MPEVVVSSVVPAAADRVWASIHSYTFVGSPIPVRNHRTTIRLLPITDGDRTFAEWSSRFEMDPAHEEELAGLMRANFLAGLRALATSF